MLIDLTKEQLTGAYEYHVMDGQDMALLLFYIAAETEIPAELVDVIKLLARLRHKMISHGAESVVVPLTIEQDLLLEGQLTTYADEHALDLIAEYAAYKGN